MTPGDAVVRPALVVWDFDGTLADTFAGILASADAALAAHGLAAADPDGLRSVVGLSLTTAFTRLLATVDGRVEPHPALVAAVVESYRTAYRTHGVTQVALFPGIAEVLEDLTAHRIPSAIATSKSRAGVEAALAALGVAHHFAVVVSDDDVGEPKPAPEMVLAACRMVGVRPDQAVMVGDTVYDVEMGQRAGSRTIAVTWGNQSHAQLATQDPTHLADNVAELRELLVAP